MTMTPQTTSALAPVHDAPRRLSGERHPSDTMAAVLPMKALESEWVNCASCGMDVRADRLGDHARTQH